MSEHTTGCVVSKKIQLLADQSSSKSPSTSSQRPYPIPTAAMTLLTSTGISRR